VIDSTTGYSEPLIGRDGPADEAVWQVVVALIDAAPDDAALGSVAAGPLEDLARYHAIQFGDRLVEMTRTDPKFRAAMSGILGWDKVPEPYRGRLLALLDASEGRPRSARCRRTPGKRRDRSL
jgi:hypothetical protein